jgi:hypothetical protein
MGRDESIARMDVFLGWFVIAVPLLVTVGATVLALKLPHERHYWKFVAGAIVLGLVFSGLTYWQQIRVANQAISDRNGAIDETAKKTAKQTTDNVAAAIGGQYRDLVKSLTTQVGDLKAQLAAQGRKVDAIGNSNIVTGKNPIPVTIDPKSFPTAAGEQPLDINVSSRSDVPDPQYGKRAMQFFLTTNKMMNGGRVRVSCKGVINNFRQEIMGAGATGTGGRGGKIDDHTIESNINFPNWTPSFPLLITVFYDEDDLGTCTFMPVR